MTNDHPTPLRDYASSRAAIIVGSLLIFAGCSRGTAASPPAPIAVAAGVATDAAAWVPPPSYDVALPGAPVAAVASPDGQAVFVSLNGRRNGIPLGLAVLSVQNDKLAVVRTVTLPSSPARLALTHDGKYLVAAALDCVLLLDVEALLQDGKDPVVGRLSDDGLPVNVAITADDGLLFVADENASRVTVIDLRAARANGLDARAIIGRIPTGRAPVGLALSPDERWLYVTSQVAAPEWDWPKSLKRERTAAPPSSTTVRPDGATVVTTREKVAVDAGAAQNSPPPEPRATMVPEGAILVVDISLARLHPEQSVVARVPAGGSPVRVALSPAGDRAYVTARGSDALLVFDAGKLRDDSGHARLATIPVGASPVPVIVVSDGRRIVVGNSNRFAAGQTSSTLNVIDAPRISEGAPAVIGTIQTGAFPRELSLSPDKRTLYLTNFSSRTLQVIRLGND